MKKAILFFMVNLSGLVAMAQSTLYIYKTDGSVIPYTISTVDSISFNKAQDSVYINKTGGTHSPYKLATIDSISFIRPGVLINGVYWASRNVAAPGTLVTNPEDAGDFYQWNSKVGWPATGKIGSITATDGTTAWNSSWNGGFATTSDADTWTSSNDPSPAGWRVPTYAEIQTLLDVTKVTKAWTTQNSVSGYKFTDISTGNSIFFPASGHRWYSDGSLTYAGLTGIYSSSTTYNVDYIYYMSFVSGLAHWEFGGRASGLSVRSVAQ